MKVMPDNIGNLIETARRKILPPGYDGPIPRNLTVDEALRRYDHRQRLRRMQVAAKVTAGLGLWVGGFICGLAVAWW